MNNSKIKTEMPLCDIETRIHTFQEVATGYTREMALNEAERCLNCKNSPCVSGCPVNVAIPDFISLIKEGKFLEAAFKIKENNSLPAVCGRVCPQEAQCEKYCVRGIKGEPVAIGRLERFCADYLLQTPVEIEKVKQNGHKVAVIGAGPAGLTCAGELIKKGYNVTVFEAFHISGGVLVYGIPEFRLPKEIVAKEVEILEKSGVEFVTNFVVGKTATIDELADEGYEAFFIGSGAGLPLFMGIPGENYNGVYSANEFLTRINLMKAYKENADTPINRAKNVAVIGGGNVAMDAARCAKRLGAENVYIIYRRGMDELPARAEEVNHAAQEGIIFMMLTSPVKISADENGWVNELICEKMMLGEPDDSGRRSPIQIENSEYSILVDSVIIAIGTSPNPLISKTTMGLQTDKRGCLIAQEGGLTTKDTVWAGGDAVTGAATVILAMGAGKTAAKEIDKYLSGKQNIRKRDR